ncbi:hypothetical protein WMY93_023148 [Mugilogobius chulae]|uniref:Copine C-terminal domain-containing protein n=1 Tax=Mugilogobius chulae TaxID=88201 RepID=A0AAW0N7W2_9GOBI
MYLWILDVSSWIVALTLTNPRPPSFRLVYSLRVLDLMIRLCSDRRVLSTSSSSSSQTVITTWPRPQREHLNTKESIVNVRPGPGPGLGLDMAQTKESIVNAASLPMSIIIVGVGPAEFDEMIELDGDDERISSQGRAAERDIVQFVPFRDYMDRRGTTSSAWPGSPKKSGEIPDQFLSYMRTRGIKPGPQPPCYTPLSSPLSPLSPGPAAPVHHALAPLHALTLGRAADTTTTAWSTPCPALTLRRAPLHGPPSQPHLRPRRRG